MNRRIAYRTFGCRLNQYDTEAIRTLVEERGGGETAGLHEAADVYVVNTCSVTARADATARKAIRRINAEHPAAKIVVTGCYAQRAPGELAALPGVALVVGAADRARVAELIDGIGGRPPRSWRCHRSPPQGASWTCRSPRWPSTAGRSSRCRKAVTNPARSASSPRRVAPRGAVPWRACSIRCAGWSTPDTSRWSSRECISATTGSISPRGGALLPALIERILDVEGVERFRLSSVEPASLGDDVITLMAESPKFARHFHIPFQSGSDAVLTRMKRRYRAEEFASLVTRIAERVPDCGIGTDVICGFPGETDEDFLRTFEHVEKLPITYVHAFTYSPRPAPRRSISPARCRRDQEAPYPRVEAALGREAPPLRTAARGTDRRGAHRAVAARRCGPASGDGPTTT